jgi:hypothetical protein
MENARQERRGSYTVDLTLRALAVAVVVSGVVVFGGSWL